MPVNGSWDLTWQRAATSPNLYNDIILPSFFYINVTLVRYR